MCFFWRAEKSLHDFCKQFELNHCAWSTDYALIILTPSLHRAPKKGKYRNNILFQDFNSETDRNNYHFCRELIYWKTALQCGCFIHCMRQKRPKKYLGNIGKQFWNPLSAAQLSYEIQQEYSHFLKYDFENFLDFSTQFWGLLSLKLCT